MSAGLLVWVAFSAAADVFEDAARAEKGILVLQVGSDWCVSGEDVRRAFESERFRKAVGEKFALAVHDEMEKPDAHAKAGNRYAAQALVKTKRFPALTLLTPNPFRFYAQIENIPRATTPEKLAKAVDLLTRRKDAAEALFARGASLKEAGRDAEAADAYGEAFDLLEAQAGDFNARVLRHGARAYAQEWEALKKLDKGDRFGWTRHFEMDVHRTVSMVGQVTLTRTNDWAKAERLVKEVKALPDAHFSPNQKQWVKVMEVALTTKGTDKPLSPREKALLREAFALGRDTFWGQYAMGRLMMDGEKIVSKGLAKAEVRSRPASPPAVVPHYALDMTKLPLGGIKPGAKLTEQQKLLVARYAVLRLIGKKGWQKLARRPGSQAFVRAFLNDREWMEDFAWSGSFATPKRKEGEKADDADQGKGLESILALEELIFQDNGRWAPYSGGKYADNEGRRFMTALALDYPRKDAAWFADVLDAYRECALAGRLHKSAYTQPVWLWRFSVLCGDAIGNKAAQQRHLNAFVNLPSRDYGSTPWMIQYRLWNCFGDSIHGPLYYKPWATAGEWPKRKYSQIVGGVCGELSTFASAIANAHGLPSLTVGQPKHCAYTRRLLDGKWVLNYSVNTPTTMSFCFWGRREWQYVTAINSTFACDRETRLSSQRMLALAELAEEAGRGAKTIELFYQHACAAHSVNFDAWTAYGEWLTRSKMSLDKQRVWVRGCARGMKSGRQPLWNFLTPYFDRVEKEKGPTALATNLVAFARHLRQSEDRIQEESSFRKVLEKWTKPLEGRPNLCGEVLKAMLRAQYGTQDYFTQTLDWGSDLFLQFPDGKRSFDECVAEVMREKSGAGKPKVDFRAMFLKASQAGNLDAFRQVASLQKRHAPEKNDGTPYPLEDFDGTLLSSGGLLRTSSTCGRDTPERYAYAIDASAANGKAFCTDREAAPWAEVVLRGPSALSGIVIENAGGHAARQTPIYVEVSEDGSTWQRVFTEERAGAACRVDLRGTSPRASHIRVGCVSGSRNEESFQLSKILVYGTKLY